MIGHSSSPDGNHFEILIRLYEINPDFQSFCPWLTAKKNYGNLIETETRKRFTNADIQRKKTG